MYTIPEKYKKSIVIAVMDGADFLDENFPGWEHKIDTEILDLACPYTCILGQVGKDLVDGLSLEFGRRNGYNAVQQIHGSDIIYSGFCLGPGVNDYVVAFAEEAASKKFSKQHSWSNWENERQSIREELDNAFWSFLGETWIMVIKERFNSGLLSDWSN